MVLTAYYVVQRDCNFWFCGGNPNVVTHVKTTKFNFDVFVRAYHRYNR